MIKKNIHIGYSDLELESFTYPHIPCSLPFKYLDKSLIIDTSLLSIKKIFSVKSIRDINLINGFETDMELLNKSIHGAIVGKNYIKIECKNIPPNIGVWNIEIEYFN